MENASETKEFYEFGQYRLDRRARVLLKHGEIVRLTPKVLETLMVLIENVGQPVSKEQLLRTVWPDAFVEESNVHQNISVLRKVLSTADGGPLIETIPKRGYRLLTEVRVTSRPATDGSGDSPAPAALPETRFSRAGIVGIGLLAVVVAALAILETADIVGLPRASRPDASSWLALTRFPDPVSQPALSPDGRMLAFVRSPSTFFAVGQIYVKSLPNGDPRQLTSDNIAKTNPVFSPDGARVAYTTLDSGFHWDTWVVSIAGGEPRLQWRDVSDLVWTAQGQVLFSERPSKAIVAAGPDLENRRTVYRPPTDRGVARRPVPSPDGRWVLLAELGAYGDWERCRVVPFDGSSPGRQVGPAAAGCTSADWSPDGRWMYLTSNAGGFYHIWRQPFPEGEPIQLTSGLTEEEGFAISRHGDFLITAVGLQSASVWLHSPEGERQISPLEGNAAFPQFTRDGSKVGYRVVKHVPASRISTYRELGELWLADLDLGRSQPLVPALPVRDFNFSPDGSQVVMEAADAAGTPRLWLAPVDRRSPPRMIPNVEGRQGVFGPGGEIFFRRAEGQSGFAYRVRPDGTGLRKALEQPVLAVTGISPDGQWLDGWALSSNGTPVVQLFPLGGGRPLIAGGNARLQWSPDGRTLWMQGGPIGDGRTYAIPLPPGAAIPPFPPEGFHSEEEIARLPGARRLDVTGAPGPSPQIYAFDRQTVQRNLYRIPIPER